MAQKVVICGIDTATLPKLSSKECTLLLKQIAEGNTALKEKFILGNMRLVLAVIKRFGSQNVSKDDLFQAGCIGLIKATDNFDVNLGVKFSTYAVPMIMGEVKRVVRSKNSMRVSRSIRDTAYLVLKTRGELEKQDVEATPEVIAKTLNTTEREVVFALDAISDTISLYEPVYNKSGETLTFADQIADEKHTDENLLERVALENAMQTLGDREQKILHLRYYEGKTQTEISQEVGLSQAQVSRLEKSALKQIKARLA